MHATHLHSSPLKKGQGMLSISPLKNVHACLNKLKTQNEIHSNNTPQGLKYILKYCIAKASKCTLPVCHKFTEFFFHFPLKRIHSKNTTAEYSTNCN